MLGLPWKRWGQTDVMLGMAAELHDRLICSCGCGQWREDAHDPEKKDRWSVDFDTCYVRRAISSTVKAIEPSEDSVMRVRLLPEGTTGAADEYADLLARFPHLRQSKDEPHEPADESDKEHEGEQQH